MKSKLLLLAFSLMACVCSAQTAVQLLPNPRFKGWDSTGTVPLALGKVCTYQAGTTTPLATYTDSTGATPNTNPVILNVAGEADIWFSGTAAYKVTLLTPGTDSTCSTGSQIWSKDNISQKYFRFDGSNVLTCINDPSVALGEFWLSCTNPGFLKWSDASAIHTVVGADSTQTLSNKTYSAGIFTGMETHSGQIQSTIATGTPPFTSASTTPVTTLVVANHPQVSSCDGLAANGTCPAFTALTAVKIIEGSGTLSGGSSTVNGLPYTSTASYNCTATDSAALNPVRVAKTSASVITVTGTGTDTFSFGCSGN